MPTSVVVYDLDMQKVAYLENAFDVGYEKIYNSLWKANFSLPMDDPKNTYCQPFWYVEIYDARERIGLFRIIPSSARHDSSEQSITYDLEHVLATLLDSIMFGYHQIGGTGIYTQEVIEYVLSHQKAPDWQLGEVDFTRQFLYSWENENLLAALFSIPKPFDQDYEWTWDTESYPWTLHLRAADNSYGPEIRYRRNMLGIEVEEDPTELCTRLYALGYGEGINQLTIESVNPTGLPYIDADTIPQFGIIERVWVDKRYEEAETLYNVARASLEKMKIPRISVSVSAVDLHKITSDALDKFVLGKLVRVHDEELDLDYESRVISLSKADVGGDPGNIKIKIAQPASDITDTVAALAERSRINEVYAQGATNLDSYVLTDNCDPDYPARLKFHISSDVVNINRALLNYDMGPFRAYSRAIAGGGGASITTPAGGGQTSSSVVVSSAASTTSSMVRTSGSADQWGELGGIIIEWAVGGVGAHGHGIPSGTRLVDDDGAAHVFLWDGAHFHDLVIDHSHDVTIPGHTHTITNESHTHYVGAHTHNFTLQDHTHDLQYGIYQGPTPSAVTVKVDGNTIPGTGTSESELSIINYLRRDTEGKIERGWHELEIIPNTLGRVQATLHLQVFIQSRGEAKL